MKSINRSGKTHLLLLVSPYIIRITENSNPQNVFSFILIVIIVNPKRDENIMYTNLD